MTVRSQTAVHERIGGRVRALRVLRKEISRLEARSEWDDSSSSPVEELVAAWSNQGWSVTSDLLERLVELCRNRPGLWVECGSGLSTLVLAGVAGQSDSNLLALEHSRAWALRMKVILKLVGRQTSAVAYAPLEPNPDYDWYSAQSHVERAVRMHGPITVLFVDGPPGATTRGGRSGALHELWGSLADEAVIVVDDYQRSAESRMVAAWTRAYPIEVAEEWDVDGRRTALLRRRRES